MAAIPNVLLRSTMFSHYIIITINTHHSQVRNNPRYILLCYTFIKHCNVFSYLLFHEPFPDTTQPVFYWWFNYVGSTGSLMYIMSLIHQHTYKPIVLIQNIQDNITISFTHSLSLTHNDVVVRTIQWCNNEGCGSILIGTVDVNVGNLNLLLNHWYKWWFFLFFIIIICSNSLWLLPFCTTQQFL